MSKLVLFELRNGENRLYQGVDRVDDSRPHLVLVYGHNRLLAQLSKQDVVRYTWHDTPPAAAPPAIRPATAQETAKHH
jgi:hypothetical protein